MLSEPDKYFRPGVEGEKRNDIYLGRVAWPTIDIIKLPIRAIPPTVQCKLGDQPSHGNGVLPSTSQNKYK